VEHIVDEWVARRWTEGDVAAAAAFWSTHLAPAAGPYPFPRALLARVVTECDGWFPVTIRALPAGSVVHPHVPLFVVSAVGDFAPLATWLETVLTHAWYASSVATLSRRARDTVEAAFEASAEGGRHHPLLPSRLHDFGFRGAVNVPAAVVGGAAHLLSWDGSDTAAAAYAAGEANGGKGPVASSIPATEHSVMMAWPSEDAALAALVSAHGRGIHACVLDTHDYTAALATLVPAVAPLQKSLGGHFVLRPDSGDPTAAVLAGLEAAAAAHGVAVNGKGYKVIAGASVVQGDGVSPASLAAMLAAVVAAGWSAENVAFGMGGGLLQKVDRDTLAFATKLCRVAHPPLEKTTPADGPGAAAAYRAVPGAPPKSWDVLKSPADDEGKLSLPGALAVVRRGGVLTAVRAADAVADGEPDVLETIWACGPVAGRPPPPSFADVRDALDANWRAAPRVADAVDGRLRARQRAVRAAGGRAPSE
jgi:nicotinamide phosphoribosyltransferase